MKIGQRGWGFALSILLCWGALALPVGANPPILDETSDGFENLISPQPSEDLSQKDLEDFVLRYLEALEGDEQGHFVRELADKFSPPKLALRMKRAWDLYHPESLRHSRNLLGIFLVSHGTETSSGILHITYQMVEQGTPFAQAVIKSLPLLSQAVPGIDVLCFTFFATYFSSTDFRSWTETMVHQIVPVLKKIYLRSGLQGFLQDVVEVGSKVEEVSPLLDEQMTMVVSDFQGQPLCQITLQGDERGVLSLEQAQFFPQGPLSADQSEALKKTLAPLGRNISHAITTYARYYMDPLHTEAQQKDFTVDTIEPTAEGGWQVRWKPRAVSALRPRKILWERVPQALPYAIWMGGSGLIYTAGLTPFYLLKLMAHTPDFLHYALVKTPEFAKQLVRINLSLGANLVRGVGHITAKLGTGLESCSLGLLRWVNPSAEP